MSRLPTLLIVLIAFVFVAAPIAAAQSILNVSYDPTREFYKEYNKVFTEYWTSQGNPAPTIEQSHGGSGKQARSVIDGLKADVVTLGLAYDVDAIADNAKLLPENWQSRLPDNSAPYTSTIVFLVRKGNPKHIKDWGDLVKGDIKIVTPNPKTSGGARWNYLAAWGYVLKRELGDLAKIKDPKYADEVKKADGKAREYIAELFRRAPVLDSGARGSTTTFIRGIGDVLLAWENEAFLSVEELGPDKFDIVVPSSSILAEPTVSLVDKNVDEKGTRKVAEAYLKYLYSDAGQKLAAKHFFRPRNKSAASSEDLRRFPEIGLFTVDDVFGGWRNAQKTHFADGGTFDVLTKK